MKKKLILIIILFIIIILALLGFFLLKPSDVLVYTNKDDNIFYKDLKLTGRFEKNRLISYEISYNTEFENSEYANAALETAENNRQYQNRQPGIETINEVNGNIFSSRIIYTVEDLNEETVNEIFKTTNANVTKKQFKEYAEEHGYSK